MYNYGGTPNLGNNDLNDKGRNTIRDNHSGVYQVYNESPVTVNAYYNFWNSTDPDWIESHIHDNDESGGIGEVYFNPFLTEDESLPVVLSSFTATFSDGKVTLKWRAETQTGNIGWNVYRSDKEDGEYRKVNASLIAGEGNSGMPIDYQFVDEDVQVGKTYFYYIEDIDILGNKNRSPITSVVIPIHRRLITLQPSNKEVIKAAKLPEKFVLLQNFPNPFNPETWIPFQLPKASYVVITIYAQDGKLVRTLALGEKEAGFYIDKVKSAYWDGRNDAGEKVGSGVYLYRIVAGDFLMTRKMVLLK